MTAPLRETFLEAMSRAAATVTVVTTAGAAGRAGVTVSAMSSVSAEGQAPTLLVCVHHLSPAATAILGNGCFAVNLLAADQQAVADTFAGRIRREGGDRFACADWSAMPSGAPRLHGALAAFDCRLITATRVGSHHVLLGAAEAVELAGTGLPLLYSGRAYGAPARLDAA